MEMGFNNPRSELSEAEKAAFAASLRRHHDEFVQADTEDAEEVAKMYMDGESEMLEASYRFDDSSCPDIVDTDPDTQLA